MRPSVNVSSPPSEDEVAARLGDLLTRLARRLRRASRRTLLPFELSDGQARTLRIVARAGAPLRMSEIARQIEVAPRSATTVIEVLEERGLVAREVDVDDRRSILVRLTPAGSRLFAALNRARDDEAAALFRHLDVAERLELLRLLDTLDSAPGNEFGTHDQRDTPGSAAE